MIVFGTLPAYSIRRLDFWLIATPHPPSSRKHWFLSKAEYTAGCNPLSRIYCTNKYWRSFAILLIETLLHSEIWKVTQERHALASV